MLIYPEVFIFELAITDVGCYQPSFAEVNILTIFCWCTDSLL